MKSTLLLFGLFGLWLLPACNQEKTTSFFSEEETIAEVNGTRLKLTDFSNYIKLFRMDHPEIADLATFPKDLYARMADQFINQHLLLQEASRRSVQVDGDAFKIFANTLSAGYPEEEFDGLLKSLALTQEEWNKYARDMYLISNLVKNEVENRIIISDSDIKEYISEHPDILKIPAQYELQQILVQESALAELILKDLRRGASFSEYVYKYSISPDKVNEGNMGLISLGLLPEDIEKAVFALKKPDEMTPIIKSNLGYHIFKLISVAPGKTLTEKDVKDKVINALKRDRFENSYKIWLEEIKNKSSIKIDYNLINGDSRL